MRKWPTVRRVAWVGILLGATFSSWVGVSAQDSKKPVDEPAAKSDAKPGPPSVVEWLDLKVEEAYEHYRKRRYTLAARVADAILTLAPDHPKRDELRSLRRRAESRRLAENVLDITIEIKETDAYPLGKVEGAVILENVSEKDIVIEPGANGQFALMEIGTYELTADGTLWSERRTQVGRLEEPILLQPGRSFRRPVTFDIPRVSPRDAMLQLVEIEGNFRPAHWTLDGKTVDHSVPWRSYGRIELAETYRVDKEKPLEAMARAIESADSVRLSTIGYFWAWELGQRGEVSAADRDRTIDLLIGSLQLDEDRATDSAVQRLLGLFVGVERPMKKDWLEWAAKRRSR